MRWLCQDYSLKKELKCKGKVWESALQMAPVHDVLHDEVATLASIKLIKVMLHFKKWHQTCNTEYLLLQLSLSASASSSSSLSEFISDCLFARHCSFMRRLLFPLHMSMAFLWQTFYLHLVKWQMRCERRRRAVCSTKHNAADGRVLQVWVCWCVCLPQMWYLWRCSLHGQRLTVATASLSFHILYPTSCNGKLLLGFSAQLRDNKKKETFTRTVPAPIYVRFVAQTDPTDDCN